MSALVEGKVCVWGGQLCRGRKKSREKLDSTVHRFDPLSESWASYACSGRPPSGSIGCACASAGHYLYIYGGMDRRGHICNSLNQLDMRAYTWKELSTDARLQMFPYCKMLFYHDILFLFESYVPGTGDSIDLATFDLNKGEGWMDGGGTPGPLTFVFSWRAWFTMTTPKLVHPKIGPVDHLCCQIWSPLDQIC